MIFWRTDINGDLEIWVDALFDKLNQHKWCSGNTDNAMILVMNNNPVNPVPLYDISLDTYILNI